jgi:hypothetical protein
LPTSNEKTTSVGAVGGEGGKEEGGLRREGEMEGRKEKEMVIHTR